MSTEAQSKPRRGRTAPLNAIEQLEAEQFNGSTVKEAFTSIDALLERREGINAEIKAEKAALNAKRAEEPHYVPYDTEFLLPRLHALPSIADAKGKALSRENGNLTVENLDLIETVNITAIWKAIGEDMSPKDQPSKSQSGGSSAKN